MMKKTWKKCLLLALLTAAALTVYAGAAEPEWHYFDDPYIDLSHEPSKESLGEVALAGENGVPTDPYEKLKWDLKEAMRAEYRNNGHSESSGIILRNNTNETVDIKKLYYNTLFDYPEETYFAESRFRYYDSLTCSPGDYIHFIPIYAVGLDEALYQRRVDQAAAECFLPGMTELEKIVAAHDWVVLNCQYDPYVANKLTTGGEGYTTADGTVYTDDRLVYTTYGLFVNRNAVCQGYTLAFKVLMNRAGIPCCYVNGTRHAWNIVQLNGAWYYVDTTWDDPVSIGSTGDFPGMVERDDLLKGEQTFLASQHQKYAPWTIEYATIEVSETDYELPAGLANAQKMAAYLIDDAFYLAESSGTLYRYTLGSGFQNREAVASGLSTSIYGAALDEEKNVLYYLSNFTVNGDETEYWWRIYELDLKAAEPAAKLLQYTQHTSDKRAYGIKLRENPEIPGTKELCTWYDYAPAERFPVGMVSTDKTMPVVIRYDSSMTQAAAFAGKGILVSAQENCTVYLACYDSKGKMLHISSLGTAAAGAETVMEIGASAIPTATSSARIIALSSTTAIPLASLLRSA